MTDLKEQGWVENKSQMCTWVRDRYKWMKRDDKQLIKVGKWEQDKKGWGQGKKWENVGKGKEAYGRMLEIVQ